MMAGTLLCSYLILKRNYLYGPKLFYLEILLSFLTSRQWKPCHIKQLLHDDDLECKKAVWGNYLEFCTYFFPNKVFLILSPFLF